MLPQLHPSRGLTQGGLTGFEEIIESDGEQEDRPQQDEELVISSSDERSKETESQKKENERITDESLPPIFVEK